MGPAIRKWAQYHFLARLVGFEPFNKMGRVIFPKNRKKIIINSFLNVTRSDAENK